MRSKVLISVLVALCMLFSFGIVKNAQADQLLFPWITKSATVSTIISVVNTAGSNLGWNYQGVDQILHYQYWYKDSTANKQTETCTNQSFKRPTSKDDLVVFDASANINDGKALFGDSARYGDASFKLSADGPRRAFLIVDNDTPFFTNVGGNVDGSLYGEALMLELSGGAAWGYIAYNASGGGSATQQTGPVDMSDGLDLLGEVLGGNNKTDTEPLNQIGLGEVTPITILPANVGVTRFFMTPIDNHSTLLLGGLLPAEDSSTVTQRTGNANAKIQLVYNPSIGTYYGGIFTDDEQPIDFTKRKNIVCTSADNLQDLMTEGAWNDFVATNAPGWTMIDIQTGSIDANSNLAIDNPSDDMIVGKLEFTTSGVNFSGYSVPGTFNNFNWIRNSMSVSGCGGINCVHNQVVSIP
jgi:hypothetical protein